jgi:3,4-dihydroxy 2-butanone 4-phosphate synthase / GTP cyclohydrolase II
MNSIPEILDDLRHGKMILLVDDEQRENEGDLVCAAQFATPETVNFMLSEGRGMMCVALSGDLCDRLDLKPMSSVNTSQRSTAYTITVDAHQRFGVTTGVSASDRATTIKLLADDDARPTDFDRPGHMQPLRARDGGTLVRSGQTEGSVDLCRIAGLRQAAVIIEVMSTDGTMARRPQLIDLCKTHGLKMCSVADVVHHRLGCEQIVERIDSVPFENDLGQFTLIAYRSLVDPFPHIALVCGQVGKLDSQGRPVPIAGPVLVRMHRQNLLGDVFNDIAQPSGKTLRGAMRMIHENGSGAVVYLRHEGMGAGLLKRLQTPASTLDAPPEEDDRPRIADSQTTPGIEPPANKGAYGIGCQILRDLGIQHLDLITNHPFTPTALSGFGLSINSFVPIHDD